MEQELEPTLAQSAFCSGRAWLSRPRANVRSRKTLETDAPRELAYCTEQRLMHKPEFEGAHQGKRFEPRSLADDLVLPVGWCCGLEFQAL